MIVPEADRTRIDDAAAQLGVDVEDVRESGGRPGHQVTVVVDADSGVDLDTLAELSRRLDPLAENWGDPGTTVVLDVTSRGVDAPLTEPRHWRRARGRKVAIDYADPADTGPTAARVGDLSSDAESVRLVSTSGRGVSATSVRLDRITRAVVTVEFSPAPANELTLLSADVGDE